MEIDRKELKRRARADMGAAQPPFWAVLLAYLCLKLYDEPVRRLLTRRFLPTRR